MNCYEVRVHGRLGVVWWMLCCVVHGRVGGGWWTKVLTHHEGVRLYSRALQTIQADIQELDATGQRRQSCQLVL